MFLFFLAVVVAAIVLVVRRGRLGPPSWAWQRHSPEAHARAILAERFANGDISGDEFLERAAVLNWTPGVVPTPPGRKGASMR